MKLNKTYKGCPAWPAIELFEDRNECVVHAKHVTYWRFVVAEWIIRFIMLGYCLWAARAFWVTENPVAALVGFLLLITPVCFLLSVLPTPRWLCRLCFPKHTRVIFRPEAVVVEERPYEFAPSAPIQFRAGRTYLSEDKFNKMSNALRRGKGLGNVAYKLKFCKVEMVYGSTLVDVICVDDKGKADQFALVLQIAHGLMQQRCAQGQAPSSRGFQSARPAEEDLLPE